MVTILEDHGHLRELSVRRTLCQSVDEIYAGREGEMVVPEGE